MRGKGGAREGVSGGRGSEGTGREGDREEMFEGRKEGGREGSGT